MHLSHVSSHKFMPRALKLSSNHLFYSFLGSNSFIINIILFSSLKVTCNFQKTHFFSTSTQNPCLPSPVLTTKSFEKSSFHSLNSITVLFFAQEGFECNLTPTKDTFLPPVTVSFKNGLGQQFKQPPGTGIDISMFNEFELIKEGEIEIYPLAIRAEASPGSAENNSMLTPNSQITQAVFEKKENGEYRVRVVKQILFMNGTRYELQEIYGVGNSVENFDGNDAGKECVVCLSELRDTAVLPCRHMCLCRECAEVLRYRTNRCPVCRQPVDRLLEMKVNNEGEDDLLLPCCQEGKKRGGGGTTSAMAEPELQDRVTK